MEFIRKNIQKNYKRNNDVAFGVSSSSDSSSVGNIISNSNKLDKSVWDENFYVDENGNLHSKRNFASDLGLTAYAQSKLDIPTIMDGVLVDNKTIIKENNTLKSNVWELLAADTDEKINNTHLSDEVWIRNKGSYRSDELPVTFQGSAVNRDNTNWTGSFYGFQCLGTSNSGLIFRVEGGGNGYLSYRVAVDANRWLTDWRGFPSTNAYGDMTGVNNITLSGLLFQSSDEELKNIISNISLPLSDISNTPIIKYTWKDNRNIGISSTEIVQDKVKTLEEPNKDIHIGTTAQYIKSILPELVREDENGLSVDYATSALIYTVLVAKYLEEANKKILDLEGLVKEMKEVISLNKSENGSI